MRLYRKLSRSALCATFVASAAVQIAPRADAASSSWLNAGSAWANGSNWLGGVPSWSQGAALPASSIAISPDIGIGTTSVAGISIDNTGGGAYSISPPLLNGLALGTLVLGNGNFSQVGGGTTSLNVALRITAPTTFSIDANSRAIVAGKFYGGSSTNSITKQGAGTLQFDQAAPTTDVSGMTTTINGGVVEVRNAIALGNAPSVIVNNGGTFQIDPALSFRNSILSINSMFFGDSNNNLTLRNGSTLRDGASGAFAALQVSLYGKVMIDNGANVTITAPTNGGFAFAQSFLNTSDAPGGTNSTITITGAGVFTLNGDSGTSNAYTGGYIINHGIDGNLTGQTYVNSYDALGVSSTGYAAPVNLVSGFLTDVHSDITHPLPNPITMSGGVLNANSTIAGVRRTDAYFSGTINLAAPGGSTIDMSSTNVSSYAGPVCNITLSGPVTGNGLLFVTAPTIVPTNPGIVTLTNTSPTNPNTLGGNVVVEWNAALAATTSTGNSNPLGSATIHLAGGELRLNHAGSGNNGAINSFATNSITLRGWANGDLPAVANHDGTITLGNASKGSTGNTIVLNRLTFDAAGTSADQTLAVQNAVPGVNYSAQFNGVVTLAGNATITTGANPADVILNNKVTGSGNLVKAGNNTLTLSGISSDYAGSTTVNSGTLVFNATHRIGALSVMDGARAAISAGGNKLLKVSTLSIIGSGALDLTDEGAILTATNLSTIKNRIIAGYNNGAWNGSGITSSSAATIAADPANFHKTALGYATAGQLNKTDFLNEPVLSTDVLVRYTLAGDANLDGTVSAADFTLLADNFNNPAQSWASGDFNYDGIVNAMDFSALATNFGATPPALPVNSPASLGSVVPEPTAIAMMLVGIGITFRRRRGWWRKCSVDE